MGATLEAGKIVTGHYSMPETDRGLNAYIASGVRCCHESTRAADVLAKMRLGMYAQLRYGSAWKDLPVLSEGRDGKRHRLPLRVDGQRRHAPAHAGGRRATSTTSCGVPSGCGVDLVTAIQMVTLNCAQCFQMDDELGLHHAGQVRRHRALDNGPT